ncbi:MAG: metallophosphoesterase family protein [Synechococcus sp.]
MFRFLHTADWQVGKPYRRIQDDSKRAILQRERIAVIARIASHARDHQVDAVLVAGDLFDSPTPTSGVLLEVLEAIGRMTVPVLVIPGNHDHGGAGSVWHRDDFRRHQPELAGNLQVLLTRKPLELDQAIVLPCPLLRQQDSRDPTFWLRDRNWDGLTAEKPRILLAHGGVQGFAARDYDRDDEDQGQTLNCLDLNALPTGAIDYTALGDWHGLMEVTPSTWYPGTPEPDRFDRGNANQRSQVLLVELERGERPQVKPLPTGGLHWHTLAVSLNGPADLDRLDRDLKHHLNGRVARDLLRLEVSGSLNLRDQQRWDQLCSDLSDRLLRLRVKGSIRQAPDSLELQELIDQQDNPLMARVAAQLRATMNTEQTGDLAHLALVELHRLIHQIPNT